MNFTEKKCITDDDIQIYYREYGVLDPQKPTILCLPGLTRNAKAFHEYALYCQNKFQAHLICPDMRGRGQSDYDKNVFNYNLMRETQDIFQVITQEELNNVIIFGTSRGGMQSAMLAPILQNRLKAVILNDIGIAISMSVMNKLKKLFIHKTDYIGDYQATLERFHLLDGGETQNLTAEQEHQIVNSIYRLKEGNYYIDYDYQGLKIAYDKAYADLEAINPEVCDLKPLFSTLINVPILLLHGENSKLLTSKIVDDTKTLLPHIEVQTIADRGHCPYLNEATLIEACDAFLTPFIA
ncbi:MAG: pimeloyl-ACP methyl ester carboxylesterase [Alphaproteobacteria bacterium]|jgi:pimeloyl-ACP methyl ester carboxylesterase